MFEVVRIAVNGDKDAARDYVDRMRAIASGDDPDDKPKIIVGSPEEFARLLGRR